MQTCKEIRYFIQKAKFKSVEILNQLTEKSSILNTIKNRIQRIQRIVKHTNFNNIKLQTSLYRDFSNSTDIGTKDIQVFGKSM